MVDNLTRELATIRQEMTALAASGLVLRITSALLIEREAVVRNQLHDVGLELEVVTGPWLSWLRVPVSELKRLHLEDLVSDSSFRCEIYFYLDAADAEMYRSRRRDEGASELALGPTRELNVAAEPGIWRMDDYRARDWKPSGR